MELACVVPYPTEVASNCLRVEQYVPNNASEQAFRNSYQ